MKAIFQVKWGESWLPKIYKGIKIVAKESMIRYLKKNNGVEGFINISNKYYSNRKNVISWMYRNEA